MPVRLTLQCPPGRKDFALAELYEGGTLGVVEEGLPGEGCTLCAFFEDAERAYSLAARLSAYAPAVEYSEVQDWVEVARAKWSPLLVGESFFLAPSWCDDPAPAGRLRLEMPPGSACGTGLHAPTQLMLAAMEQCLHPGDRVLDLGAGSGILSAAAMLLGASGVFACDIEEQAVRAALEYTAGRVLLFVGSARSLRSGSVDVVLANINATALGVLASEIRRVLRPEGRALLCGFTRAEVPALERTLDAVMLASAATMEREEWVCLIAHPKA